MTGNRRGTAQAKRRQEQVAQQKGARQVEQLRGSTTGSSSTNEEVGDDSTNGEEAAGDEPRVPRTVCVGEEGTGKFVRREDTMEDEGSATGGSNTVVTSYNEQLGEG
jgi:hypothetical protein